MICKNKKMIKENKKENTKNFSLVYLLKTNCWIVLMQLNNPLCTLKPLKHIRSVILYTAIMQFFNFFQIFQPLPATLPNIIKQSLPPNWNVCILRSRLFLKYSSSSPILEGWGAYHTNNSNFKMSHTSLILFICLFVLLWHS